MRTGHRGHLYHALFALLLLPFFLSFTPAPSYAWDVESLFNSDDFDISNWKQNCNNFYLNARSQDPTAGIHLRASGEHAIRA